MLCCAPRMLKSIFIMRRNAILLVVVIVLGIFGVFQLFDYTVLCNVPMQSSSQRRRHLHNENIDPDTLAELKKRWILEYEEERKINDNRNFIDRAAPQQAGDDQPVSSVFVPIHCNINGDYNVDCLRQKDTDNIYMPWSFLEKYYEVYGKLNHYDGYDRFEFFQSHNQVLYDVNKKYKFDGVFLTFETYNVEVRDRVKLITGVEGVPLSTQWGPQGYFYPIQIAQFGLSHFSKNITEKPPSKTIYEDGEMTVQAEWKPTRKHCTVENIVDPERSTRVIKFDTPASLSYGSGIALTLGNTVDFDLSFDVKFTRNGSISVLLDTTEKKQYYVHYVTDKTLIKYEKDSSSIIIGIGDSMHWRHISRNLVIDLKKGVGITKTKSVKKIKIGIRKVVKLILRGGGFIDNITISTTDHMTHFLDSSYWLLENQVASTGGWPIMVQRKFDGLPDLPPGWHSAMAQGHGLSIMVRAYKYTRNSSFLPALRKALKPYTVPSAEGGVKAIFMEKYVWYEEYPTTPGSFVLNGFIYSLLGLYDYKMLLSEEKSRSTLSNEDQESFELVTKLYDEGMTSLKNMLPLYDGGARTFYDLRHFQLKCQPNIARWDYHTTHMSQLALLATIDDDPVFKRFYEYWHNYLKGIPAKHN